ncbi:MAG: hypothetical protein ABIB71_07750 [Candidatus Woesearchaeota archaeon]
MTRKLLGLTLLPLMFGCATAAVETHTPRETLTKVCDNGEISAYLWNKDPKCIGSFSGYTVLDSGCNGEELQVCDEGLTSYAVLGKRKVIGSCFAADEKTAKKITEDYWQCLDD